MLVLAGCGKKDPVVIEIPEPVVPVENEVERPTFNTRIDAEDAFDKALGALPADGTPQFVEVIDNLDADSVQAAEEGEKLAVAMAMEASEVAESEARGIARAQNAASTNKTGLEFRTYSEDLYTQTKGVKPAIIYFTSESCEECATWEAGLRADAMVFAEKNALILMADFDENKALVEEMKIPEAGWAMMLTGVGELMGPRPSERLTKEDLLFIFQ
jgi:hypothetical protein